MRDLGSREGYMCRLHDNKAVCRFGEEREMQVGRDYMLMNDEQGLWALDCYGYSDPLFYHDRSLKYGNPYRFPPKIRDEFNRIMFMLESYDIVEETDEWKRIEDMV